MIFMKRIFIFLSASILFASCVTGGFDENPQLDDLNDALAKAPKIDEIRVNGILLERNTQSVRVIEAAIGEQLDIEAEILSGKSADLTELEVSRQYYWNTNFTEDPLPLDGATTGFYDITGKSYTFSFQYTVPDVDDDDFDFHPGDQIYVYFRALNDRGNYGYKAFEIHIIE
jgi:hypothetical protein